MSRSVKPDYETPRNRENTRKLEPETTDKPARALKTKTEIREKISELLEEAASYPMDAPQMYARSMAQVEALEWVLSYE